MSTGLYPLGKPALLSAQLTVSKELWAFGVFLSFFCFFKQGAELIPRVAPAQPGINLTHFTCVCVTLLKWIRLSAGTACSRQLRSAPRQRPRDTVLLPPGTHPFAS